MISVFSRDARVPANLRAEALVFVLRVPCRYFVRGAPLLDILLSGGLLEEEL